MNKLYIILFYHVWNQMSFYFIKIIIVWNWYVKSDADKILKMLQLSNFSVVAIFLKNGKLTS